MFITKQLKKGQYNITVYVDNCLFVSNFFINLLDLILCLMSPSQLS